MADKFNLKGFKVDENDVCTADGGFVGEVTGGITLSNNTSYPASGAINLTYNCHFLDSSGSAKNMTLGSSLNMLGRIITISASNYTSAMTVAGAFGDDTTTATFTAKGQGITLIAGILQGAGKWFVVGNNGVTFS